jgi:hypothetical protein
MNLSSMYIVTITLLVSHQIDAAYWKEWEMFRHPGGIQFFDIFNLALIPILLIGLRAVILQQRSGYKHSLFVSFLGILTFIIHSGFYLFGFQQFNLPVSAAIIIGCGAAGIAQFYFTLKSRNDFGYV